MDNILKRFLLNSIISISNNYLSIQLFLLILNCILLTSSSAVIQVPSTYKLDGINSYAKYSQWQLCLNNDTFEFEFSTNEYNCIIFYSQFNAYTYIQIYLSNGYLKMKFRIHDTDDPDGIYLEHTYDKLNNDKWHLVTIRRFNEFMKLIIDDDKSYTYKHKNTVMLNENEIDTLSSLFVFGGLPNYIQTYDLSSSTVLFEKRFKGYIRNPRILNCSMSFMQRITLIESNGLSFSKNVDSCTTNPCLNNGLCIITDFGYKCDCTYGSFEGIHCEKCKFFFVNLIFMLNF
jgi:hypothetical protein